MASVHMPTVEDLIADIEQFVQRDEGGRGIKDISLHGELLQAARALLSCKDIVIITGFPCLLDYAIPTETDGPLGALAIAKACLGLGKRVVLLTDEVNEEVMLQAVAGSNLQKYLTKHDDDDMSNDGEDAAGLENEMLSFVDSPEAKFIVESFPAAASFDAKDQERLNELVDSCDMIIAIERPGPSQSGNYFTMRKRDMTPIISPLERIITGNRLSIGIGDGGNEVGMGKVYDKIICSNIPHGPDIACIVSTDYLIVSSVSNWGGYALSGALAALVIRQLVGEHEDSGPVLGALYSTVDEQISICEKMIAAGARDGVTGKQELCVDGMTIEVSLNILTTINEMISNFNYDY